MRKNRLLLHGIFLVIIFLAALPVFSGCKVAGSLIKSMLETEYDRDIERRGPGSQEAWLNATGGSYNGNLPRN